MTIASLGPWVPLWAFVLMLLGAVALVVVMASLFLPDWAFPELETTLDAPPGSEPFVAGLASLLNVPRLRGGEITLLDDGDAFYPAMLEAIRGARETVNFQVYIFEPDDIGLEFCAAFMERARAGVEVRVLFDGFGGHRMEGGYLRKLEEAGCRVAVFRPIRPWTLVRAFRRDHRRAIVIDGRIAFTGGAAVAEKWRGHAQDRHHWRDSMVRVTGPLAAGIQTAFGENWAYTTGELLTGPRFYPRTPDAEEAPNPDAPHGFGVASSPAHAHQPMRLLFWSSFRSARERLLISTSYFIPDPNLRATLAERARAGVEVRLLLPGPCTDAKPVRYAARAHYEELLAAGVRIHEYQPTMHHAKAVVVDGIWCVVGSANLDQRSMKWNEENVLGVADRRLAARLERSLRADLERSREIRLGEWRSRPWTHRVVEWACRPFAHQY
ncbi:MAG TPA: phospholipase D-like domain-containing protein [Gemmatimonadales bacterium]|nr:phospholipase D-like domain-containing protein [Gemmatimonadales bacterium]